jgi:hypothetical protein
VDVQVLDQTAQRAHADANHLIAGSVVERHAPDERRATIPLGQLALQPLEGFVAADEDATLDGCAQARDPARCSAREQCRHEQCAPQSHGLNRAQRAVDERALEQHDEERIQGRALKQRRRLIHRRLVDDQFVTVVEPMSLARDDDQRQREQRDRLQPIVTQDVDADEQRNCGREDVRNRQAAAKHRLANPDL